MIDDIFLNIELTFFPWNKSHLAMVHNSLYIVEFNLLIFIEDFSISVHENYWSLIFLSYTVFSGFIIRGIMCSMNELGSVPSTLIFWKSLENQCHFFLLCSVECMSDPNLVPPFLFWKIIN